MTLILGLDFPSPSCSQFANTHFPLTQIDDESKFNLTFFSLIYECVFFDSDSGMAFLGTIYFFPLFSTVFYIF